MFLGGNMQKILFVMLLISLCGMSFSGDVKVKGYFKKDGTYVDSYIRSRPNSYKWDNKSYTPSQNPYNKSYFRPKKSYNSKWTTPNETRFNDSNPYNDTKPIYRSSIKTTPKSYEAPKVKSYMNPYSTIKPYDYEAPKVKSYVNPYSTLKSNFYETPKVNNYTNPYSTIKTDIYETPKKNIYTNPYSMPKTNIDMNDFLDEYNSFGFGDDEVYADEEW